MVFVAAFLLLGTFVGGLTVGNVYLEVILPLVMTISGIILALIAKKNIFWILLLAAGIGAAAFYADYAINFDGNRDGEYTVSGTVENVGADGKIILSDLIYDGNETGGKAVLYCDGYDEGDKITVRGKSVTLGFDPFDSYSTSFYCDGIYYKIENYDVVKAENGEPKGIAAVKKKIKNGIELYIPSDDAGIIESLIFGDKTNLSYDDKELINGVGMAHIFAVSGLHIGFLAAAILFLLKKLRVNNYVSAAVLAAVFVIYGIMTGMPSGVKRAAITFIVFLLAKNSVRKSDPLTSLAFSAVIIILTNPRELFDVGFIMSYGAVFGIIAFYKPFFDILKKISGNKVYRYFAKILATTMSANIFVLPVSFNVFNTVAVYSVIGNLIILPLVSVVFVLFAAGAALTAVYSGFAAVFAVIRYPVILLRALSKLIYSLPYSTVAVGGLGVATVFYLLAFAVLAKYVLLPDKIRFPLFASFGAAAVLCVALL